MAKKSDPRPSDIAVVTAQKAAASIIAAASLAMITLVRCGVVRNVAVAVWWKNSFVTTIAPRITMKSSPKNWPDV